MVLHIDPHQVRDALDQCVVERGSDYVYPGSRTQTCYNWHTDTDEPGCIVGLALYKLGVSAAILKEHYTQGITSLALPFRNYGITFDPVALKMLTLAQVAQDRGAPWGAALVVATTYQNWREDDDA